MSRETTVLPTHNSKVLDAVETLLRGIEPVELASGSRREPLPPELRDLLAEVVRAMRRGQAVSFAPLSQQLTTQQAADLLGVSRPTLVKILEAGRIPYDQPGRHRRIRLTDVLTYQAARRAEQREALRELARDAQELGLYEDPGASFDEALAEARKKNA